MLVKEYRIPLPLTVEEYRIAQLYMIAKKSRQESRGAGSGVEILTNEPYTDGPGGSGQYTHKIYHIGSHLPGWFKALLPKSALTAEEEAWNSYPYTKTRYTSPFVPKFYIEIETKYIDDAGDQENAFNLSGSDLRNRIIDVIDVVKDQLYGSDYMQEEDPKIFHSEKANRGPLQDDWLEGYRNGASPGKSIMCAYKVCRVEFRYWGMQTKIEKFIHDVALRKTMLRAHRQAWAWQDEWQGLTMEDIRQLERETQEELARKMNIDEESQTTLRTSTSALSGQEVDLTAIDIDKDNDANVRLETTPSPNKPKKHRSLSIANASGGGEGVGVEDGRQKLWSRSGSKTALISPTGSGNASFDLQFANWRMESIVRDSESSEEEFFDAEENVMALSLARWSSVEMIPDEEDKDQSEPSDVNDDSIFSNSFIKRVQIEHINTRPPSVGSACAATRSSLDASLPSTPTASPAHQSSCTTTVLALVMHAGSVLDSGREPTANKKNDVHTFANCFESVMKQHYPTLLGHLAFRMIPCPAICSEGLAVLANLSPYSFQKSPSAVEIIYHSVDAVPLGALPLFAISAPDYQDNVSSLITAANEVYKAFLKSEEGTGFNGQVILVADSVASLMAYDALCRNSRYEGRYGSETSINDTEVVVQTATARSNPLISISDGGSVDESLDIAGESKKPNPNARIYRKSHSHPQESEPPHCDNFQIDRLLSAPNTRRHSSASSDPSSHLKLDFDVSDFFMFGSPLGTVLAYRKMLTYDDKNTPPPRPSCNQVYNLFHPTNPCASRIEPLLSARFTHLPPINIPRYQRYPVGDGQPLHLLEYIQTYPHLFMENHFVRRTSEASIVSTMSGMVDMVPLSTVTTLTQKWWGLKRLDYALYCPEGLAQFPVNTLPHLFHGSYWESNDVISFILRQVMRSDSMGLSGDTENKEVAAFIPTQPREKWLKKRTSVKLKNVTANHRANDVIVRDGLPQTISARFMYGPLDMVALTGEKVDIHVMKDQRRGEWIYFATEVTDKNGRLSYTIPKEKALGYGMFPVKLVVRGDHTSLDFFLTVIPPKTECIVFSIDGSFTASVSVTGKDPKVRAGAVDVVRHWQDLGYLIIYITGRPDMQQRRVMSWLSQHNFPLGLVYFIDGISTDPLRYKTDYLRHLQTDAEAVVHCGYGSSKDISVYSSIGLKPDQIFVVGKASKKQHLAAKILTDGYAAHLSDLKAPGASRPAQGNARMILFRGCFGLPGQTGATIRQRRSAKRTTSFPLSSQNQEFRNPIDKAGEISKDGSRL